jgi:glycosyltransferase involved in cell wall biosynthesis
MSVSACVICFNEERNLRRCLESVSWADEIVIVDSFSQDRTLEIAKGYTGQVFERKWTGYRDQKNFALSKASGDWILSLDADEVVSEVLRQEIQKEISRHPAKGGYRIPRRSYYQGRWINHSSFYPDRQLRLFRRELGTWVGGRVHERVEVRGDIGLLKNDLLHYPYQGSISGQLKTIASFSTLLAEDMYERGEGFHLGLLLLRPPLKFVEVYVLKLGFLDGLAGLIIAVSSAYAMFVRYVKLRELSLPPSKT